MTQAVSSWPLKSEARVRSRFSPCRICGRQGGTGIGFYQRYSVFPVNIIPPRLSVLIYRPGDEQ
jgi:hypothetical protein